ncbi:hypothetical protein Cch01nite_44770 [Cellulomonas chitinilytica]|uniref:Uncharacterized protein n=1 Tax=Cellulomonas chitinilytica TaxID=398759 RepID=A0A919U204_9CELL|nr:hypothetical protein Cch01nite_44770 [Cellulomonas chitinilytica]
MPPDDPRDVAPGTPADQPGAPVDQPPVASTDPVPEDGDPVLRVRVQGATLDDLRAFADEVQPDPGCRAVAKRTDTGYSLDVYLEQSRLDTARGARAAAQVTLDVVADETANGRARQQEVGTGDRYAARGEVPRGLGTKEQPR